MKLIPMTDFVLNETNRPTTLAESFKICVSYAQFLKQTLKLEMFIPCDEDGNILEEPDDFKYFMQDNELGAYEGEQELECIAYLKAKRKVLFEGFEIYNKKSSIEIIHNKKYVFQWIPESCRFFGVYGSTIESLSNHKEFSLSIYAIKQIT